MINIYRIRRIKLKVGEFYIDCELIDLSEDQRHNRPVIQLILGIEKGFGEILNETKVFVTLFMLKSEDKCFVNTFS